MGVSASMLRNALEERFGLRMAAVSDVELLRVLREVSRAAEPDLLDPRLLHAVVDRLPIDESSLFRNEALWTWLREALLPELVDEALQEGRTLRALSLGCAAGQEVFSLAIALLDQLRTLGRLSTGASSLVHVRGVDASASRIEQARSGVVYSWSVDRARREWIDGWVHADPANPGRYQVDRHVRAVSSFEEANLVELVHRPAAFCGVRLVMCQHVLIYFREETALKVLEALVSALEPGTVLVITPIEAHLLMRIAGVESLGFIGAFRVVPTAPREKPVPLPPRRRRWSTPRAARNDAEAHVRLALAQLPTWNRGEALGGDGPMSIAPRLEPVRPSAPPSFSREAEQSVELAFAHLEANRREAALVAAQAACDAEPQHLIARLLLGQLLLSVDAGQGRRVLKGLSEDVSKLDRTQALPYASELSVEQLRSAVQLLLDGEEGS